MTAAKELASYFSEAASWDADRAALAARHQRIAWILAGAGWVSMIACALAIAFLMPLKTVVPYLIRVDSTTGLVDVVPQYSGGAQLAEVFTRQLLRNYVNVCERFVWASAESDYEECGAFNSARRNQQWASLWTASNPASPLNLYKDGSSIIVRIKSLSFFERANGLRDLAQVRYVKVRQSTDGSEVDATHWIATIQYAYGEPSKIPKVTQWNPLGFRVLDFRPEPEMTADGASKAANAAGRAP